MLDRHLLANIGSRLQKQDLQQCLLTNKNLYDLNNEIFLTMLESHHNVQPSDLEGYGSPRDLYVHKVVSVSDVDQAAEDGQLDAVKFYASLKPPILPTQTGVNKAAKTGKLETVQYLASLNPPILNSLCMTADYVNETAGTGNITMIKILALSELPKLPDQQGASWAAINGYLEMVKFLTSLTPPILPTQEATDMTVAVGRIEVVQYLVTLNLMPTEKGANGAAERGNLEMVKYLAEKLYIFPSQTGVELACTYGHLDVVKYLLELGIKPTQKNLNVALAWKRWNILRHLALLDKPIRPTNGGKYVATYLLLESKDFVVKHKWIFQLLACPIIVYSLKLSPLLVLSRLLFTMVTACIVNSNFSWFSVNGFMLMYDVISWLNNGPPSFIGYGSIMYLLYPR